MVSTTQGRREFGHGYSCDCPTCANCEPEYLTLDSAHPPIEPRPVGSPSTFSGIMVCVAIVAMFWLAVAALVFNGVAP